MNRTKGFDNMQEAVVYAAAIPADGYVATARPTHAEDMIYRVATVTAVLFILITMV